jgi:cysteine desulfurase
MIYLDHNATTPLRREVLEAMLPYLDGGANPSSAHAGGRAARAAVEQARRSIAAAVGARSSEVVFTGGGTEANNMAVFGAVPEPAGAHLVISPIEHASVLAPVRELERRGARVTWLPVDRDGRVRAHDVAAALEAHTRLVSVGWANNEIGTVQPIAEIGALCRARGARLHVDAVQALGKVPVDVGAADLCSFSAHKLGGPMGVGALVVRNDIALRPLCFGGEQERGRRPGTESVAGVVGFAAALATQPALGVEVARLRDRLWSGVALLDGVRCHSLAIDCLPNTLSVGFADVRGESLVAALDLEGVAVSVGSACAAGSGEPSHVLRAIGCDDEEARGGVRFSLGPATTTADIDAALAAVRRVVERMRVLGRGGTRAAADEWAGATRRAAAVGEA